jgi:DNA-binding MarR family transcriptional regulator
VNRRLERELQREIGIPLTFFEVMLRLARTPGDGVALNALAGQVSFSSGGFSRLVDRIEERGLVERRPCPTNRRSTLVALTGDGRRALRRAFQLHAEGLQQLLIDQTSEDELRTLAQAMRRVRDTAAGT